MGKIYKRVDFAKMCGCGSNNLTTYFKRGKIIIDKNGLIDTGLKINKDFLEHRQLKMIAEDNAKNMKTEISETKKQRLQKSVSSDETTMASVNKYDLELHAKELEIKKKEQDIELGKIKIAKAMGKVIPTDLVKSIFAQHFKSVTTAFHQQAENLLDTVSKQTGMKREQLTTMRGELISIVNKAIEDAATESKDSVKNLVNEYSEKRGVGESR